MDQEDFSFERIPSMERAASQPEDQAAMTIEFLRARLLSERSVSKAARQRAQQLAKKISELEQRVESEIHMRKKLEAVRQEMLSKHKGELMENYRHLFMHALDEGPHDDSPVPSQQGSLTQSESKFEDAEAFTTDELNGSEGNGSNLIRQDDAENGDDDDMDRLAREKGILGWASGRGNKRLQDKEWAQSPGRFSRSFSPRSFGTLSPDRDSPRKRWVGKSVRQIRTRTFSLDIEGDREVKQEQAKDGIQSDEERDEEVERVLKHQTQLIEQFEAEENVQREWEKKFWKQNRPKDDICKEQASFADTRDQKEEDEVLIISDEQGMKDQAESTHANVDLPETVDASSKQHAEDVVGETLEGHHVDITAGLATELSMVSNEVNAIAPLEAVEVVNNRVSAEMFPEGISDKVHEDVMEINYISKNGRHNIMHGSSRGSIVVVSSDVIPNTSTSVPDDISPIETPLVDPLDEAIHNQLDIGRRLDGNMSQHRDEGRCLSSSIKLYAASVSSSQAYANNQEQQSEGMSRESSERPYRNQDLSRESFPRQSPSNTSDIGKGLRNRDYSQQSFGWQPPSITCDNDKAFRMENYEDIARRSAFGSPPANKYSSSGSSKSLMSSSWEEIFKRRIRAQENAEKTDKGSSVHPRFQAEKHQQYAQSYKQYAQSFNTAVKSPCHDNYPSPYLYGDYEGRRHDHRKSMDAGLDRVMEVLRALQIAKHHVESSDEHVMDAFAYPPQFKPNVYGYFSSSPARGVEPFMYNIDDMRVAAGAGYVRSPSRPPISMQHAWIRGEPIEGQHPRLHHGNYAYSPYAGHHM